MATQQLGIGGNAVELKLTAFDKRLLSRFRAKPTFAQFGMQRSIPRHGGKAISFRRLEAIYPAGNAGSAAAGSAPAALTEGTPGAAIDATWSEVQATVSQYGQYLLLSDMAENQSVDDVAPEYVEAFGESMADCLDLVTRDVLVAGTNVQYASIAATRGGASGVGSGMYLTLAELREAKRTLKRNNAKGIAAADGKLVVITHPDAAFDLEGDSNLTNVWQYAGERGQGNQLFDGSMKDLPLGFRLIESTNARIFVDAGLSAADVYTTLVLADQAYGTVKLDALPAKVITKDRGTSGVNDPLDQICSIGWKAAYTAVRLNESLLVRIEHATSSNNMG
jgi:N4-gp56 family major capsid protein